MTGAPLVSVVIPLYNKEATIARALRSVITQDFADLEIVIVDDGSTDGAVAIVEGFNDPRIVLTRQANAGPGAARNTGVAQSRGSLIAFLDADDEWLPGHLHAAVAALDVHPECAGYVCAYDTGEFRQSRPNKVVQIGKTRGAFPAPTDRDGIHLKRHVDALHSSCVVVRKSMFTTLGGFFAEDRCRFGEDSWFYARLVFSHPLFWEPAENTRFHIEDSDLGFAVRQRASARPISLFPDRLAVGVDADARDALRRLSHVFAQSDYAILTASRAWPAATRLRRQYRLGGRWGELQHALLRARKAARSLLDQACTARKRMP